MEVKQSTAAFGVLWNAIFIDIMGFGLIIPLFPFIVKSLDTSAFSTETSALGWMIAIYSIVQFIFAPLWGTLSDRVGRRPIILVGVLGTSLSFTLLAFSSSMLWVMISRGIQGFFTAASLPTARAFIADTTPVEDRARRFGLLGAAFGVGFAFGPMIGGFLSKITISGLYLYSAPAFFAAGLSIMNFIIAYRHLEESLPLELRGIGASKPFEAFTKLKSFSIYPGVLLLVVVFGIFNLSFSGFESLFSKYVVDKDSTLLPTDIGLIFAFIGTVSIIIQVGLIGPITKKIGDDNTLLLSLVILSAGFASYIYITTILSLYLLTIPIAIGASLFSPSINSSLSKRIPMDAQGGGLGLNSSLGSLGRIFGPLLYTASFYYKYPGDITPFYSSAFFFTLLVIIVYMNIRSGKIRVKSI